MSNSDEHDIQDTSLQVYYDKVLPELTRRQSQVLEVFYEHPWRTFTNAELSKEVGLTINQVTPRTKELRDMGVLKRVERRECRITGNKAYSQRVVS